jgi:hypothetical protein
MQKWVRMFLAKIKLWKLKEEKRLRQEKEEYEKNKDVYERREREKRDAERMEKERRRREEEEKKRAIEERRRLEDEMRHERERQEREVYERELLRREKEEVVEKYTILKKVREEKIKELQELERVRQKRLDEHQKIKNEISELETGRVYAPTEPTEPKRWILGKNGSVVDFTLTDARIDLVYRLKNDKLYTMEESKILIKEIVKKMKQAAEIDLKNLMFLSKFRTELLFPRPIQSNILGPGQGVEGFLSDSPEIQNMIYGPDNYDYSSIPKDKLRHMIVDVNKGLVKMIDTALRQRKERMLMAATILSEIELNKEVQKVMYQESLFFRPFKSSQQTEPSPPPFSDSL